MRSCLGAAAFALAATVFAGLSADAGAATVGAVAPGATGFGPDVAAPWGMSLDARMPGPAAPGGTGAGLAQWRGPPAGIVRTGGARRGVAADPGMAVEDVLLALVAGASRRVGAATGPVAVSMIVVSRRGDGALELRILRFQRHSGPVPAPLRLPGGLPRMVAAAHYPAAVLPVGPAP
jgi:hypothetical protein